MRIDLWSDIACPWCWLGKHHLEEALRRLGLEDAVRVEHHAYELRPQQGATALARPYLERKLGGAERLAAAHARLELMGRAVGIEYRFADAKLANTFDAHRLVKLANERGVGGRALERLMRAYHGEGADVASPHALRSLSADIGLPAAEVEDVLSSQRFAQDVRSDEMRAQELGISGVPFFVLGGRHGLSGAQPVEAFVAALRKAQELETASPGAA